MLTYLYYTTFRWHGNGVGHDNKLKLRQSWLILEGEDLLRAYNIRFFPGHSACLSFCG